MIKAKNIKTLDEAQFLQLINQRPAGEADEKFLAKKVEEEKKIVSEAKKMLSKDAPSANSLSLFLTWNSRGYLINQRTFDGTLDIKICSYCCWSNLWQQRTGHEARRLARCLVS